MPYIYNNKVLCPISPFNLGITQYTQLLTIDDDVPNTLLADQLGTVSSLIIQNQTHQDI